MMDKIEMLEYYIRRAEEIINDKDAVAAKQFQREVIAVYDTEIPGIRGQLDNYSLSNFYGGSQPDYLGDAVLLKAKLMNYLNNLQTGLYKVLLKNDGTQINVSQEMNNATLITLEQVINVVNQISEDSLSAVDKELLAGKLATLTAEKDKKTKWDKAKEILKWLGDKTVEVGVAALPYIAQALQ